MAARRSARNDIRRAKLGAYFHPWQLQAAGVDYDQLVTLVAEGVLERVSRGLYRLSDHEPTEQHSLAIACAMVPTSVVCLLSALQVHGIGTRVPRETWLAIPHKARPPRAGGMKLRLLRFSGAAWTAGVVDTFFEGVPARITTPARTVLDCFRFERLIGREAALEALRDALHRRLASVDSISRILEILPSRRLRAALEVAAL